MPNASSEIRRRGWLFSNSGDQESKLMTSAVNENAIAFLNQIDSINGTDVSPERVHAFASEEDFNGVTVELLIEVGSYVCVAANLFPGTARRWNRNQAILGGHLVRLYKLISAL